MPYNYSLQDYLNILHNSALLKKYESFELGKILAIQNTNKGGRTTSRFGVFVRGAE